MCVMSIIAGSFFFPFRIDSPKSRGRKNRNQIKHYLNIIILYCIIFFRFWDSLLASWTLAVFFYIC